MLLVFLVALFTVSLVSCRPKFQSVYMTDVPIQTLDPDSEEIDLGTLMVDVQMIIKRMLPGARFRGMVFSGQCKDVSKLRGRLVVDFIQTRDFLNGPQILVATASIDVIQESMTLTILDESTGYPSMVLLPEVTDHQLKEITQIAYRHITEQELDECDVTVTQGIDQWDVRCGSLDDFIQQCRFAIDTVSGAIIDSEPLQ